MWGTLENRFCVPDKRIVHSFQVLHHVWLQFDGKSRWTTWCCDDRYEKEWKNRINTFKCLETLSHSLITISILSRSASRVTEVSWKLPTWSFLFYRRKNANIPIGTRRCSSNEFYIKLSSLPASNKAQQREWSGKKLIIKSRIRVGEEDVIECPAFECVSSMGFQQIIIIYYSKMSKHDLSTQRQDFPHTTTEQRESGTLWKTSKILCTCCENISSHFQRRHDDIFQRERARILSATFFASLWSGGKLSCQLSLCSLNSSL